MLVVANLLLGKLPNEIGGYKIHTDFRVWIVVEQLLQNPLNVLDDVVSTIVELIFENEKPTDYEWAFTEILDFLNMYQDIEDSRDITDEALFDWEVDDAKVFSAFMRTYHINLREIEYMHVWEFKSLLEDIAEDCLLSKAKYYRSLKLSDYEGKQRDEIRKVKRYFEIK